MLHSLLVDGIAVEPWRNPLGLPPLDFIGSASVFGMVATAMIMDHPHPHNTRRASRRRSSATTAELERRASVEVTQALERLERRRSSLGLSSLFAGDDIEWAGVQITDALFGGIGGVLTETSEPASPEPAGHGLGLLSPELKADHHIGAPAAAQLSAGLPAHLPSPSSSCGSSPIPSSYESDDGGFPSVEPNFTDLFAELRPDALKPIKAELKPAASPPLFGHEAQQLTVLTEGPDSEPIVGVVPGTPPPPYQPAGAFNPLKRGRADEPDGMALATPQQQPPRGGSSSRGTKRPRRQLPQSAAVREAMPKPPRRGRKDPVLEAAVAGMTPEQARLEKNRTSAKECRLRKKEYVSNLEKKVIEFEAREAARAQEFEIVQAQLRELQQAYAELSRRTGAPAL